MNEKKVLQEYELAVQQVKKFEDAESDSVLAANVFTLTKSVNDAIVAERAVKECWRLRYRYRERIAELEPIIVTLGGN